MIGIDDDLMPFILQVISMPLPMRRATSLYIRIQSTTARTTNQLIHVLTLFITDVDGRGDDRKKRKSSVASPSVEALFSGRYLGDDRACQLADLLRLLLARLYNYILIQQGMLSPCQEPVVNE